jgi:hypothetical protein
MAAGLAVAHPAGADRVWDSIQTIDSPATTASGEPNLCVAPDGRVILSWIEPADAGHALRFAVRDGGAWSAPATIARGADWFVNWADFPSVLVLGDNTLAAHWLAKSGPDTYAYDVNIALSHDGGKKWSAPIIPHRDGTETEHGFVSMVPWTEERFLAVWLDGRKFGGETPVKEMTLRGATIDLKGAVHDEVELDTRVCECCQTAAAQTSSGAVVLYRDRSDKEIRDIWVVRYSGGQWQEPRPLYMDGWEVPGCPVNGASVDADGERVAAVWYTAVNNSPRVKVVFSDDEGATFGRPIMVDDGRPMGRADIVMLSDGSALVSWLEMTDAGAEIRARVVTSDGKVGDAMTVSTSSVERSSGFPRMVRAGNEIVFAWTEVGEPNRVRTAVTRFGQNP